MKLYLASSLSNANDARAIAELLKRDGWEITYPWWTHGSVQNLGPNAIAKAAIAEAAGVRKADVFLGLLPGARGTHVELGMALALQKPVVLAYSSEDMLLDSGQRECSFHRLPAVRRVRFAGMHDLGDLRVALLQEAPRNMKFHKTPTKVVDSCGDDDEYEDI